MAFSTSTETKTILTLKKSSTDVSTVTRPVVLGATTLSTVDRVLIADKTSGYILKSKASADVTLEDLENDISATKIRAFGLDASGVVICGIIFLSKQTLDVRDALVFPEGVIEVHTKTSTSPSISYA